ncbi:hypothetical protein SDC9_37480 [bioreactor metagenome]|uniref:Uncharacterized protein n=1 Tax=bioreactor metagenome TaxID=1076179 RepID=A0A644VL95_9ZZZZ|nr:hypothetical protein [Acidaminococcaceae bacterium]
MFKPSALGNSGAEVIAQVIENDVQNQSVDDNAVLASGIAEGTVVKWSKSLLKCVVCDGTVALGSTDTIGIVSFANGTSGQVKFSGVYVDNDLATPGTYYCQSNGTIGTTVTKVFVGTVTSAGRLVMPGGGGGSITPATPTDLGGVMVGVGLAITPEGLLSTASYPAWFTDRGDGSDGDYAPTASGTLANGVYNFKSVYIPAGVTVTCSVCTIIKCQGAFVCAGNIVVTPCGGTGGTGSAGAGAAGNPGNGFAGGAGHKDINNNNAGGPGGAAFNYGFDLSALGRLLNGEMLAGAGGGAGGGDGNVAGTTGGNGGGSIKVVAGSIVVTGSVTAKGANGVGITIDGIGCGGGGGGGAIAFIANTLYLPGTVSAAAGLGGINTKRSSLNGVAGSAGIVYLKELGAA